MSKLPKGWLHDVVYFTTSFGVYATYNNGFQYVGFGSSKLQALLTLQYNLKRQKPL